MTDKCLSKAEINGLIPAKTARIIKKDGGQVVYFSISCVYINR